MTPLTRIARRLRRPLRIHLTTTPDKAAAALRGLAFFVRRRPDLDGHRIRIDLTIRTSGGGR
jgi:hypothetical protein